MEGRARRRLARRILRYLLLLYIAASLDRVNVAYAGLQDNHRSRLQRLRIRFGSRNLLRWLIYQIEIPGALIVENPNDI